eukprot:1978003-Pleurochrysis_carterae.AAC.4
MTLRWGGLVLHDAPLGPVLHDATLGGPVLHDAPLGPVLHDASLGPVLHDAPLGRVTSFGWRVWWISAVSRHFRALSGGGCDVVRSGDCGRDRQGSRCHAQRHVAQVFLAVGRHGSRRALPLYSHRVRLGRNTPRVATNPCGKA